ncbi:MAG: class I SAM-dependent methyltransferase [Algibacter sp.]|uniref:class I SAM-dependent methyltransferase n=1 Tax=Algibacter sp. TaxID=1872428 RepID=UPI0026241CBF|nr:class I SAM-dependent methyltransferase [Algibacter sp.]MDG1729566.1 class I SAM-dependent methyltransferase [Algibacter sp.]MDG2179427.1 class I SAM-dependent methyltransferase [Algibacter sp.]
MRNLITWIKFKGWFIFDLPYFIKENNLQKGVELGAKAGRSMYFMLRTNKQLHLTGIDLWEVIEGGAYKNNNKNEIKCKRKLKKFKNRTSLIKGDAKEIADTFPDAEFDFLYYDLQCKAMLDIHQDMLSKWIPKIKKGGLIIGRDFRDFRSVFYNLGYTEEDFKNCTIKNRVSQRLEYLVIT